MVIFFTGANYTIFRNVNLDFFGRGENMKNHKMMLHTYLKKTPKNYHTCTHIRVFCGFAAKNNEKKKK